MNAIILTAIWGVVMMYVGVFVHRRKARVYMAIAGILLLLITNWLELVGLTLFPIDSKGMLEPGNFGLLFNEVTFFSTLIYFLLSGHDFEDVGGNTSDYFALIFFVLCGISIVTAFKTLLMLFLGIEIISIPLYILAGSDKRNLKSNEAALKYFLMGAFSTGLMLMGITLLYGSSGTFQVDGLNMGLGKLPPMIAIGLVLMMISMAFKVSAAPFHFWTPDVYDGAPTVFTSFMATVVKAGAFFAFLRLFDQAFGKMQDEWRMLLAIITAATLLIGNITAVFQQSVKRMMAYSSIAQAGFMLLAVFALNQTGKQGLLLYATAYSLATIGVFAVLTRMKDYTFEGFTGLSRQQPLVAFSLTVCLLSLAGIPLTAGFFAKYYMLLATLRTGHMIGLVILAVLCAAISVYYYFRVVQAMYFREGTAGSTSRFSDGFKAVLLANSLILILLGIHPDWLLRLFNY